MSGFNWNVDALKQHVADGASLKEKLKAKVAGWPTETFRGENVRQAVEAEEFRELIANAKAWFNYSEMLCRGVLTYDLDRSGLLAALSSLLKTFFKRYPGPVGYIDEIDSHFGTAFSILRDLYVTQSWPSQTAFILMWMDPKKPELLDILAVFKDVFSEFGIKAQRADDFQHQDVITQLILNQIRTAQYLVADLTGARPNVYYEIGYAHALGKQPLLFRKAGTRLHFDLSLHNAPEYRNITELKDLLRKRLLTLRGRHVADADSTIKRSVGL